MLTNTNPRRKPTIKTNAGTLLFHFKMASGNNSPNTMYSIAPLAKPKLTVKQIGLIIPSQNPNIAPIIVGRPELAATRR